MVMRLDDGTGREKGHVEPKAPFWWRTASGWCQADGTGESTYILPGRPTAWRRADRAFAADCDVLDRDADRRVVETVRLRALGGDTRAQALSFRAARGFARPVDVSPPAEAIKPMDPELAAAMIEAGLNAVKKAAAEGRSIGYRP
jgi:hypothetical protein